MGRKSSILPANALLGNEMPSGSEATTDSMLRRSLKPRASIIAEAPILVQKKRYSIIPTTENISKIVIASLKGESPENQKQIISLLSELPSQEKNTCKEDIFKTYMELIKNAYFKRITADEASNVSSMLMEIAKTNPKNTDLIATLIILTQAPSDLLK